MIRQPDFFIVGAPKCGTTSLAYYLGSHPQVFVTDPKEPNYFARSLSVPGMWLSQQPWHTSLEQYLELYAAADEESLAVGEASTRYLRCVDAQLEIRGLFPNARMIACLRNPVDLAESWHAQKVLEGQEPELDFERAWRFHTGDELRSAEPHGLAAIDALDYTKVASIGSQLRQLHELFPADSIQVVFQDELARKPRQTYVRVLEFLGVADDGREEFPRLNFRSKRNFASAGGLGQSNQPAVKWLLGSGESNQKTRPVGASADLRREITDHFANEIDLLEEFTGRDLDAWRAPSELRAVKAAVDESLKPNAGQQTPATSEV